MTEQPPSWRRHGQIPPVGTAFELAYAEPGCELRMEGEAEGVKYVRWTDDPYAPDADGSVVHVLMRCAYCGRRCLDNAPGSWTVLELDGRERRVCAPTCQAWPFRERDEAS